MLAINKYRKALEAIANDPLIGAEVLDPAAQWYRGIAARALGKLGGQSKSLAKAAASRKNGKLGGRPKTKSNNHAQ